MICENLGCGKECPPLHFTYLFDGGEAHYCSYVCALESLASGIRATIRGSASLPNQDSNQKETPP